MKPPLPKCPVCKSNRQVKPVGVVGDMFQCGKCHGLFDASPDEGSDVFADPSRRMELQEERAKRGKR